MRWCLPNVRRRPTLRSPRDCLRTRVAHAGSTKPTSICCDGCGLSYTGGRRANGIFAQRSRALDPAFWRLLLQIRRFQREAVAFLESGPDDALTYREFLDQHGFDQHFVQLLPGFDVHFVVGDWRILARLSAGARLYPSPDVVGGVSFALTEI